MGFLVYAPARTGGYEIIFTIKYRVFNYLYNLPTEIILFLYVLQSEVVCEKVKTSLWKKDK